MKVFQNLKELESSPLKKPILTLGVFDGLHLGHQSLLNQLMDWAREEEGTPTVLTFTCHPMTVLRKNEPFPLVQTVEHRLRLLQKIGVEGVILLPFDENLARMQPEEFFRTLLYEKIGGKYFLMGYDSRFGYQGKGNFRVAQELGRKIGVEVRKIQPFLYEGKPLSSSLIRKHIREGNLKKVEEMLGRPYAFLGKVIQGERIGHQLGFPTANLKLGSILVPPFGVYVVEVALLKDWSGHMVEKYYGLANIGVRPTVDGTVRQVEVHLPGFQGDLYGSYLHVRILKKVREERKFASLLELQAQIRKDCQFMEEFLKEKKLRL